MSSTVTYDGGTVTLTDAGLLECSTRDLALKAARKPFVSAAAAFRWFQTLAAEKGTSRDELDDTETPAWVRDLPQPTAARLREWRAQQDAELTGVAWLRYPD